jgi:hypothetical protein
VNAETEGRTKQRSHGISQYTTHKEMIGRAVTSLSTEFGQAERAVCSVGQGCFSEMAGARQLGFVFLALQQKRHAETLNLGAKHAL